MTARLNDVNGSGQSRPDRPTKSRRRKSGHTARTSRTPIDRLVTEIPVGIAAARLRRCRRAHAWGIDLALRTPCRSPTARAASKTCLGPRGLTCPHLKQATPWRLVKSASADCRSTVVSDGGPARGGWPRPAAAPSPNPTSWPCALASGDPNHAPGAAEGAASFNLSQAEQASLPRAGRDAGARPHGWRARLGRADDDGDGSASRRRTPKLGTPRHQ